MTAILVVTLILAFFAIDAFRLYLKRGIVTKQAADNIVPFRSFKTPMGIFMDESHTWAKLTESGEFKIGLDELVLQAVKDITKVEFLPTGSKVRKGEMIGSIRYKGKELNVYSPVSGTVIARNEDLFTKASTLYEDPYFGGWLVKVWPVEVKESIKSMMIGESARKWMDREYERFTDFLAQRSTPALGAALADGAKPVMGAVHFLDERGWNDFEAEFLKPRS